MKELDLTNAKYLKLWLTKIGSYKEWKVSDATTDICTLTRMTLLSGAMGIAKLAAIAFILTIVGCILFSLLSALSIFTLLLPEMFHAPLFLLDSSLFLLAYYLLAALIGGFVLTLQKQMKVVPEYFKFNKKSSDQQEEKKPSQTWIAVKEMYKSFKEKTCIKVKL